MAGREIIVRRLNNGINRFPDIYLIIYGLQSFYFNLTIRSLITSVDERNVAFCHIRKIAVDHNPLVRYFSKNFTYRIIHVGTVGNSMGFFKNIHLIVKKIPTPYFNLSTRCTVTGFEIFDNFLSYVNPLPFGCGRNTRNRMLLAFFVKIPITAI